MSHEIGKADRVEIERMDLSNIHHNQMRLACCIPIEEWMNGMRIQLVDATDTDT